MTATTAPDFRVLAKVPRLVARPGMTLRLLVLAADGVRCAGVDTASGALVRAWSPAPDRTPQPYDLVDVVVGADDDALPDPFQPERIAGATAPTVVGHIRGRRAERMLRPLLHPVDSPLLGLTGPAVRFWERRSDSPSIALVESRGPIRLRREGSYLSCRFTWQGAERELACLDRRTAAAMDRAGQTFWLAPKGSRMVVALTPPMDGHCHKVVEGLLPRS